MCWMIIVFFHFLQETLTVLRWSLIFRKQFINPKLHVLYWNLLRISITISTIKSIFGPVVLERYTNSFTSIWWKIFLPLQVQAILHQWMPTAFLLNILIKYQNFKISCALFEKSLENTSEWVQTNVCFSLRFFPNHNTFLSKHVAQIVEE